MKKIFKIISAAVVGLSIGQSTLLASSHREAPLISNDPLADNTDLYAFKSPCDANKVVLIANYIPFEHPAGGPNWYTFGENIRYEIHIDNNTATTGDDIIYRFTFQHTNQDPTTFFNIRLGKENIRTTYVMSRSVDGGKSFSDVITDGVVPPPNIGPRSIKSPVGLGAASYDALMEGAVKMTAAGEKVFCGPADDPFFVDLGAAFDVGGFRKTGRDGVAKFNCHSICIEVPVSMLQKDHKTVAQASNILDGDFVIGVYASASRKMVTTLGDNGGMESTSGDWVQVSRLGMPLTNEAIIPIGMKDKWNATKPADDLQFASHFMNPELGLYMDDSRFGAAVPGLADLRMQTKSLGAFDFRNDSAGLYVLKGNPALTGTALDPAIFGDILLPNNHSPRAVDILPIFYTGVPNLAPYQLATGKPDGSPLSPGKPFINNFLPTLGDLLRLNMAVPATPRTDPNFSSLGIIAAAVQGLTNPMYANTTIQFIPNMDGFPNGRRLEDDVTTIELQAVSGVALAAIGLWYDDYTPGSGQSPVTAQLGRVLGFTAGVTKNDTTLKACFPYVQGPWQGFAGPSYTGPRADRLYVDASVSANGNGTSWKKAMKELSAAVAYANTRPAIKQIFVANGTYKTTLTENRAASLTINRGGLEIIGGFEGSEEDATAADPSTNTTTLTADIGTAGNDADNTYHVFTIRKIPAGSAPLSISGFTIEKGNANVSGSGNNYGGAAFVVEIPANVAVNFSKCNFRNNKSTMFGGAVCLYSAANFTDCQFESNMSADGGAIFGFFSSFQTNNVVFKNNTASNNGGAVYVNFGTPMINNSAFQGNSAVIGGAVYQNQTPVEYRNTVFHSNASANGFGGAINLHGNGSTATIYGSSFYGNMSKSGGGAINVLYNNTLKVYNSVFWKNTSGGKDNIASSDIAGFNIANNCVIKNSLLQSNSSIPANNGSSVVANVRGSDPWFMEATNPTGADGKWFTNDDGLYLSTGSPAINTGDNSNTGGVSMDIAGKNRIACTTVDMGAYETQNCGTPALIANNNKPAEKVMENNKLSTVSSLVQNPVKNELQLRYNGEEKCALNVYGGNGKSMFVKGTITQGITRVNVTTWNPGIYQVVLTTESGKTITHKVMKL